MKSHCEDSATISDNCENELTRLNRNENTISLFDGPSSVVGTLD